MSQLTSQTPLYLRGVFGYSICTFRGRLMAGRWVLVPEIGVRVPAPEPIFTSTLFGSIDSSFRFFWRHS